MPAGRPAKISPEVQKLMVNMVVSCVPIETAAEAAGISERTHRRWMEVGLDDPGSEYGEYRRAILGARAQAEVNLVVREAVLAQTDAVARRWLLTHAFQERWGLKEKLEVTGKDGGAIELSLSAQRQLIIERIDQLAAKNRAARDLGDDGPRDAEVVGLLGEGKADPP